MARKGRGEDPPSGRIQRRLPQQMQQEGVTLEAQREAPDGRHASYSRNQKPPKKRRQKTTKGGGPKRFVKRAVFSLAAVLVLCVVGLGVMLGLSTRHDYLWLDLGQIPYRDATILYYTDTTTGEVQEYARINSTQHKEYVDGAEIPQQLRDAFVAIEDKNFYSHSGVDIKRTVYAFVNEAKHMLTGSYIGGESGRKQGASTITQQLVKNLTRDDEATGLSGYFRKIREIWRAFRLDAEYEKEEILNAYLNSISFTGNTAGVQAEARKLFGKSVSELTLAECASLAAITNNPSRYNPVTQPENHLNRRNYVLQLMLEQGYITAEQHDAAVAEGLNLADNPSVTYEEPVNSYFTDLVMDSVRDELMRQYGVSASEASGLIYNGGLRVYTTVVPALQASMEQVMENRQYFSSGGYTGQQPAYNEDGTPRVDENGNAVYENVTILPEAAMVSVDYEGRICAVVGGLGEKTGNRVFNNATQAKRQVGSTMKGIGPYVQGIERDKITWSSAFFDGAVRQVEDEETGEKSDWPRNVTGYYSERDWLVADAFAQSVNTIAVRVGDEVGYRNIYRYLKNTIGISSLVKDDIDAAPLALGANHVGISPLDMARAYSVYGNGGYLYTTHCFTRIENGYGGTLLELAVEKEQVVSEETAYIMNRLMKGVMQSGTAAGKSVRDGMDSVGKTGTTNDYYDHWFVGLTPYYSTAVWYGYEEPAELRVDNANHPPTLAWRNVMESAQQGLVYKEFPVASGVVEVRYCTQSGHAAGDNCPSATGYYKAGNLPKEGCPIHG